VTFIGYTAKDPNNSAEKVSTFVEKRGPKLGYTFAYADDRETYNAWMKAAGRNGIPCSFVVDKAGKIAYIGHPMYLDEVLPKVAAGTWKTEEDSVLMDRLEKEVSTFGQALGEEDTDAALKAVAEFDKNHPLLTHIPYFIAPRLNLFLKAKKYDEAKKLAEEILARAVKQDDPTAPRTIATVFRGPQAKDQKELLNLSLKAAEVGLKVAGDRDALALLTLAQSYFALGEKGKAKDFGSKPLAAAENDSPNVKQYIESQVKKLADEDKDKDK
jgi:hypothetical protein